MSIIQTIRDRAWIIAAAIAIALIAFIVQDAFQGGGGMGLFGGASTTLGKVDGKKIEYQEFETRFKQIEDNYAAQGQPLDEGMRIQFREQLWNQYVEEAVLRDDYDKLGLAVTNSERGDILYGSNPPPMLAQQFKDSLGNFDAASAYAAVNSLKRGSPQYEQFWGQFVPELEKARLRDKFTTLIAKSAYVPKWLIDKTNNESSQRSGISYVMVPYSTIADSTIKVTNEDIQKYVSEHSKVYTQEKSRGISYVTFDAGPTQKDSTDIYNLVNELRDKFAQTTDPASFVVSNNSETPFYDGYVLGSKMQMEQKDTLRKLPVGQVYGPYIDGDKYVLAKKIDERPMPDSVTCRHILIKMADQQAGQVRTDSAAHKLIDSIVNALNAGTPFDTLVVKLSEDQGSQQTGGKYDFASTDFAGLSKEFAEVIFYGKTGDKKTVKVENAKYSGYHYIEVLNQKKIEPAYKIAYFSRQIVPSDQTVNAANGLASQFVAESRDYKSFEANAKKRNLNVYNALDIKPLESTIVGIGASRELVRWVFKADKGDVAETPFSVGDKFVVPVLTQIFDKGPMAPDKARPMVEYRIRNDKKAEQIIKKIGNANTLEAVAQATGQQVQRVDSIAFNSGFIPNLGAEPKVLGAAFNTAYQAKPSGPIKGEMGVFVVKVDNIGAVPNPNFDAAAQRQALQQQQQGAAYGVLQALKKAANIKDYRDKFY
jgi:peptidyl-prolyl cis-trans isomerase D